MISIGNTARIPDKKISDSTMGKILDKRTVLVFKLEWNTIIQAKEKLSKGKFGKQEFNLTSFLLAFVNSCICIICLSSTVHNRVLRERQTIKNWVKLLILNKPSANCLSLSFKIVSFFKFYAYSSI